MKTDSQRHIPNTDSEDGTIFEFIRGEKTYDGVWFGDKHPTIGGQFWWRAILKDELERLKPCTETGAVDEGKFAEWCGINDWYYIPDDGAGGHSGNDFDMVWSKSGDHKTTSELLEIFKAESNNTQPK